MKFLKTTVAAAVAVAISGGAVSAATFDFAADAETFQTNHSFEGTFDQVYNDEDSSLYGGNTVDGITVQASAYDAGTQDGLDPFMDSISNRKVAGLGVCSNGFTDTEADGFGLISDCSTGYGDYTGDDNLLFPEILELTFSGGNGGLIYSIDSLLIRDADHNKITDEDAIIINGITFASVDGYVQGLSALASDTMFFFTSTKEFPEIYLSVLNVSEVPVPAAGFLLLGGLGGLAAMKRRKKAA